jgi:hypothetical protein
MPPVGWYASELFRPPCCALAAPPADVPRIRRGLVEQEALMPDQKAEQDTPDRWWERMKVIVTLLDAVARIAEPFLRR